MTTADLLDAWRNAARAAELAEKLASMAEKAVEDANANAHESTEIAQLAEQAAHAAAKAATSAREAANKAIILAQRRLNDLPSTEITKRDTNIVAQLAQNAYHEAEDEARRKHKVK